MIRGEENGGVTEFSYTPHARVPDAGSYGTYGLSCSYLVFRVEFSINLRITNVLIGAQRNSFFSDVVVPHVM